MPVITSVAGGIRIAIHVQPRASRTELAGVYGDAVRIRLAAPPVDGAANEALVRFLADCLSVPRASIRISSGLSGRRKSVLVTGLTVAEVSQRLEVGGGG